MHKIWSQASVDKKHAFPLIINQFIFSQFSLIISSPKYAQLTREFSDLRFDTQIQAGASGFTRKYLFEFDQFFEGFIFLHVWYIYNKFGFICRKKMISPIFKEKLWQEKSLFTLSILCIFRRNSDFAKLKATMANCTRKVTESGNLLFCFFLEGRFVYICLRDSLQSYDPFKKYMTGNLD